MYFTYPQIVHKNEPYAQLADRLLSRVGEIDNLATKLTNQFTNYEHSEICLRSFDLSVADYELRAGTNR